MTLAKLFPALLVLAFVVCGYIVSRDGDPPPMVFDHGVIAR